MTKFFGWLAARWSRKVAASAARPALQPALEAQGRLWAEAFLHNPHGVAIVDPTTNSFRSVNGAFAKLLGVTPEDLQGKPVVSVYPATEHAGLWEAGRTADTDGSATLQTCQIQRDGTLMPVEVNIVSVRDRTGRPDTRIVNVSDLRERLRLEGELRHTEARLIAAERFRQLAESAPIGILLMGSDGACHYANPGWVQMSGLRSDRALDLGWREAIHVEDRARVVANWERMTRGAPFDPQFRYQRESGEVRWVQSRANPLRDDSGAKIGYICVGIDVTEQLQQRAEVDRFHDRVRSLAARLQHLREEERAELAQKLHGNLRQGLTTLHADINALRTPGNPGQYPAEALTQLAGLADRCLNDLRHIAFELHPPGIEDLGFIGAVRRYAEEWAGETGLEVSIASTDALPNLGSRRLIVLYRIFQEALTNVIKHARAKSVTVQISVHDGSLRLRMTDDGIGMGEGDRNKPGAFGLLAASERLSQIGGTLRVLGVAGQGTTLDARVPIRKSGRKRDAAEG